MNCLERDKFLTEFMGKCFHDDLLRGAGDHAYCRKCKTELSDNYKYFNYRFSTWDGFGILWEWAETQKWWNIFLTSNGRIHDFNPLALATGSSLINPTRFADAIYNYLKNMKPS